VTSYDYGAPCNENGRPTRVYYAMRKQLASYLPAGEKLPEIPAEIPSMSVPEIKLDRWTTVWDTMHSKSAYAEKPACFESFGQNQGMMLYRSNLPASGKRRLSFANLHDYGQVFLDGKLIGTLDRRLGEREIELPECAERAPLEILVEGMGHINFSGAMDYDRKGIYGDVKLGSELLKNWAVYPVPLDDRWFAGLEKTETKNDRPGGIFKGRFKLDNVADTFLDMSKWKKGVVWVNGHNLGRFWSIGPQQRLYCPAPWLKSGQNTIIVLDLVLTEPQPIEGKPERN
jgi:hypothetical protein